MGRENAEECVFCKIVKGQIPAIKITESANFIVIKDAYPKVKGHSLVIPKEHYDSFSNIGSSLYEEFMKITREAIDKISAEEKTKDYNLVINNGKIAGQLVPHLHLHILPRRDGDGFGLKV